MVQVTTAALYYSFHKIQEEKPFLTVVEVYTAYLERLREGQEGPPNHPIKRMAVPQP